ncbi:endonuclease/exonuclease/phosphatase family protein [Streptomyces sp. 8P21H-1]|uniref:endonuclease/exonuclease/phosphatase family protein n=1 Tax=Streptomyces sp. 8P21H-1 TaxID=2737048 RepID=UPI0034A0A1B7
MTNSPDTATARPEHDSIHLRNEDTGVRRPPLALGSLAVLATLVMLGHALVPNRIGHLGSLVETFLPWTGLAVPLLLLCASARRSRAAVSLAVLSAVVWCSLFGGTLVDKRKDGGNLTVVTHNVNEHNPRPVRTARALAASGADVVALEELGGPSTAAYERTLAGTYPYHSVQGTVGLWSRYPVADARAVAIAPWPRALRATVRTPEGPVAVFVVHLMSVRFTAGSGFTSDARDAAARRLAAVVRAEPLPRTILVGDLNGTTDDRAFSGLTSQLRSVQTESGAGFGASWPAPFPVARIDHILVRGVQPRSAWTLPATGSDHLPVAASVRV